MQEKNLRQNEWNSSYMGGGNILFYPHEEIIRFINKYVRKRIGYNSFENVMKLSDKDWRDFKSLDLGCGCGRHVKFLNEFGLNPYGIDLSDAAISLGKEWFTHIGEQDLVEKLIVGNVENLPFENNFFNICVSHGVLDSMPRDIAQNGLKESLRCLKKDGMMYFDLIMSTSDKDEIQTAGLEKDTVQSYFTVESIKNFISTAAKIIDFKIINWTDSNELIINKRAHIIIKKL